MSHTLTIAHDAEDIGLHNMANHLSGAKTCASSTSYVVRDDSKCSCYDHLWLDELGRQG